MVQSVRRVGKHCVDKHSALLRLVMWAWSSLSPAMLPKQIVCQQQLSLSFVQLSNTASYGFILFTSESIILGRESEKRQHSKCSHKMATFFGSWFDRKAHCTDKCLLVLLPTDSSALLLFKIYSLGTNNRSLAKWVIRTLFIMQFAFTYHNIVPVIHLISCHCCILCEWMSKWWPLSVCTIIHILKLIK